MSVTATTAADPTKPVLIGYDGSPSASAAVDRAASLFRGRRTLLGSVSTGVMHHTDRPVLIVPTDATT